MAAPSSKLPAPGTFVTPQAGDGPSIQKFFDPNTYRGKTVGLPSLGPREPMTDLTPETIRAFFDPETYRGKHVISPPLCSQYSQILSLAHRDQKRPGEPAPTAQHGAKHQRLGKSELLDRFREAAELNGFVLEDLVVTGHEKVCDMDPKKTVMAKMIWTPKFSIPKRRRAVSLFNFPKRDSIYVAVSRKIFCICNCCIAKFCI